MATTFTRKEFLSLTIAAGAVLTAEACGDSTTGTGGAASTGNTSGSGTTTATQSGAQTSTTHATSTTSANGTTTSTGGANACSAAVVAEISCPHTPPHALTVPLADIMAGVDKTYDIKGMANHSHMITVKAADFAKLQAGETVYIFVEAGANQDHCVTLSCGVPGDPMTSGQCDAGNAFSCN